MNGGWLKKHIPSLKGAPLKQNHPLVFGDQNTKNGIFRKKTSSSGPPPQVFRFFGEGKGSKNPIWKGSMASLATPVGVGVSWPLTIVRIEFYAVEGLNVLGSWL